MEAPSERTGYKSQKTSLTNTGLGEIHHSSENQWLGRTEQELHEVWDSYDPPFTEPESNALDRVPSLDRNSLVTSLSCESPPEFTALYDASQWLQTHPIDWSENELHTRLRSGQEIEPQLLESLYESAQEAILDAFPEQSPNVPPDIQSYTHLTPNTDNIFSNFNFQEANMYSKQSKTAVPLCSPARHGLNSLRSAVDTVYVFSTQSGPNGIAVTVAPISNAKKWNNERSWNCFVIEDGSGMQYTAPEERRKGIRKGRLTEQQKRLTAERRKQGNTCIRCRFTRVAVGYQQGL